MIIYIIIGSFTVYNAHAFRIQQIYDLGLEIKILDITEMIGLPKVEHKCYKDIIISVKTREQLCKLIHFYKKALFLTATNPEKRFFWLYYYLAKFKCKHIKIANGWIAEYGTSKFRSIVFARRILKYLLLTFMYKIKLISLPRTIFLPGYYWNNKIPGNPDIINVNHLLYDQILEKKSINNRNMQSYILFLDGAYTHHPDWKIYGQNTIDSNIYYNTMKMFFDKFEEKFNMPVIVAGHPKSNYKGNEFGIGKFGQRKIILNQTDELATHAEIFLAHLSTTRLMAIVYHRPLYLIWPDSFSIHSTLFYNYVKGFSKETGCPILSEKNLFLDIPSFTPDFHRYKTFLYKYYIAEGYENTNTLDIIGEKLYEEALR